MANFSLFLSQTNFRTITGGFLVSASVSPLGRPWAVPEGPWHSSIYIYITTPKIKPTKIKPNRQNKTNRQKSNQQNQVKQIRTVTKNCKSKVCTIQYFKIFPQSFLSTIQVSCRHFSAFFHESVDILCDPRARYFRAKQIQVLTREVSWVYFSTIQPSEKAFL